MMDYGYYGGMMGGLGWLWMVLVLVLVIALGVWGTRTAPWSSGDANASLAPLEILRRRYAAGEITASEFEQARRGIARSVATPKQGPSEEEAKPVQRSAEPRATGR